jgi:flagellar biosynthesis regulator FlbT
MENINHEHCETSMELQGVDFLLSSSVLLGEELSSPLSAFFFPFFFML